MESNNLSKGDDDGYLSKREILLRNYQIKLMEKAKRQNSIIYLPTGAGKTLIAIHVLTSRTKEIIRPFSEGGKRAFFLTPTKVMVDQVARVLCNHTKFRIVGLTGDMNVDSWSKNKWELLFEDHHVFVLTGEILRIILYLNFISPAQVSLVVLDECHHATYEHPYKLVVQALNQSDSQESPLLLGLSSVLLKTTPKVDQIEKHVNYLETLLKGKVITENHLEEVLKFSASPKDKLVVYNSNPNFPDSGNFMDIYDNLLKVFSEMVIKTSNTRVIPYDGREFKDSNMARKIKNCIAKSKNVLEELGIYGGSISALFFIIYFEKMKLLSKNPAEIQAFNYARTELLKLRWIFQNMIGEHENVDTIIRFSSHKVQQLFNTFKELYKGKTEKDLSTIIFVKQRVVAVSLSFLLKRLSSVGSEFSYLKPDFVIGNSHFSKESVFMEMKNEEVVLKLAARSVNVLVATNLLEEGIDVSACNIVISFDFPSGYPSYFQSRGRARDKESSYFMFTDESNYEARKKLLESFHVIEKKLLQIICEEPEFNDDDEDMVNDTPETIVLRGKKEFITVDGIMAIAAVQRYCSKLPQDKHTYLSPRAWYACIGTMKKAFVQLPMNCPLRKVIEGDPRSSKRGAKRSAFLYALKRLHELGELNDELNPRTEELSEEDFTYLFPYYRKEGIDKSLPQPGTNRRRQMYKVKFAECLSNCLPMPGVKAYLHVIDFLLTFEKPPLDRKVAIYETLKLGATFALLSSKKLHKILKFPLFLDMGQVNCDLLVNYDELTLSQYEINDIKQCHFTLFKKVTKVLKNSQIFDNRNKEHSFFVVPVEKNEEGRYVLNWNLIRCDYCQASSSALVRYNPSANKSGKKISDFFQDKEFSEMSSALVPKEAIDGRYLWGVNSKHDDNREPKFVMTENDYRYFIIFPNYRNQDFPQHYIVNKFCQDMSPLTAFPREQFEDYISYYKSNYAVEITNVNQPLLRVSPIFGCSNFNLPRNRKFTKEKSKNYEEHLVPELCDVIPFDRRFYLKALLLPTVLNRIYHVYCVEEFRRKMFAETGLGVLELPEGTEWSPLHLLINSECEDETLTCKMDEFSLPLSKLKNETQKKQKDILDPERHMYEVGLCDLEFFVSALKDTDSEPDLIDSKLKENNELEKLAVLRNSPVPPIKIITRNASAPELFLGHFVQAFTAKSTNDFINYERLEILGDSFLKFATTLFLFKHLAENEGILTTLKGKLVGNRNLMYCGLAKSIPDILNVNDFAPLSDWSPPLACVPEELVKVIVDKDLDPAVIYRFEIPFEEQFSGVLTDKTFQKNQEILQNYDQYYDLSTNSLLSYKVISDKTISDCVEALIGVFLLTSGIREAFDFLSYLKVLPTPEGSYSELIQKPYTNSHDQEYKILEILQEAHYTDLEEILNYKFKNKALLLEAITHPSYFKNQITDCYQRLEFLGDAVLDFLITGFVYECCSNFTPGQVTDIRSSLVNNVTFACLAVRYDLHKYLLSFSSSLLSAISTFVSFQVARNHVVDDNVLILMNDDDCAIAEATQVPKALGDIFESLAGAIYLDSGNSLETVWNVYYILMKRELDEFTKTVPKTPMQLLSDICGDKPYFESQVVRNGVVMVTCSVYFDNEEIKAFGFGNNGKDAKRSASKIVINKLLTLKK